MLTLATTDFLAGVASVAAKLTTTITGAELVGTVESYKVLYQGQLAAAAASLYDTPDDTVAFVQAIHIVNTDPSTRTFSLFMNGTDDAHKLIGPISLPTGYAAVYGADGWAVYSDQGQRLGVGATGATGASGGAADYAESADISTQAFGDVPAAGASVTEVAGANHVHGMPANPITAHLAAGDPHGVYALDSEKGAANGYASLDATTKVPVAQLGTGTPDGTKFLRDDRTFAVPAGGGGAPSGAAGGDLGGTYPNPSVVDDSHAHTSTTVTTHSTAHAHSATTGITANDHHNRDHASTHLAAGADPLAIPVPTINVYTSGSGSWSKPAGARYVKVRVVGGGGGGGGSAAPAAGASAAGSGGGGGGYVEKTYAASALSATEAYAVGAAGSAGAAGANNGGNGGNSTFSTAGNLLTASGGALGEGAAGSSSGPQHPGGSGGAATGGDLNSPGGDGKTSKLNAGITVAFGDGGGSALGTASAASNDVAGGAGHAYGGGGAGGTSTASGAARAGGAGAAGVIIVETYF